jgi:large subunit ribosomal protein L21e
MYPSNLSIPVRVDGGIEVSKVCISHILSHPRSSDCPHPHIDTTFTNSTDRHHTTFFSTTTYYQYKMPHSFGVRARTRHMFAKKFRHHGPIHLSQYLMNVKVGDYVDIFADPSIHKGMPHKGYHGRTGIIFNVTKSAVGVRVNKLVNGRVIEKRIHVRIEHIRPSKCQKEILRRKKENEAAKAEAAKTGVKVNLKRTPKLPKEGYFLKAAGDDGEITTIQPLPFSDLV